MILVLASGCASRSPTQTSCAPAECEPTTAPSPSVSLPPGPDVLPQPNITLPYVQFLDCQNVEIGLEVPDEAARSVVPADFVMTGLTGPTTSILVTVTTCQRVVNQTVVLGPAHYFQAYVFVYPENESWTTRGYLNYYLLDPATDNDQLMRYLVSQSVPVVPATFARTVVPVDAQHSSEHWTVDAGRWSVAFDLPITPSPNQQQLTRNLHIWYADKPAHRIAVALAFNGDTIPLGGEFVVTGESQLSRAIPGGTSPHAISGASHKVNSLYQFDGSFGG